ncbi:MAG: ABC transporter ATP-binding protein [Endomicrobia bacterium]|nr:ABC transporter ATP-binding protein [Endomicrobiia bacterium]
MEILKIKDLYSGYTSNRSVIRGISFSLKSNIFLGIIGPNASGKSTLLKTIAKILQPRSGQIIVFDKDIEEYNSKEYSKIVSFATEISDYSKSMRVEDFIFLARYPWGFDDFNFEVYYKEFELENILYKNLRELSAGELQRTMIAASLAQTPKLLLLDEPVSHLDIAHQINILNLLKKFNIENKLTIIASFHELNLASEYCDELLLLNNGEIVKQGKPQEVLDYLTIEKTYSTKVVVKNNPISKKPYIIPVPIMWEK